MLYLRYLGVYKVALRQGSLSVEELEFYNYNCVCMNKKSTVRCIYNRDKNNY